MNQSVLKPWLSLYRAAHSPFPAVIRTPHISEPEKPQFEIFEPRLLLAATITGTVYHDANNDHVQNPTETGVAGVTVFMDFNRDGVLQTGAQEVWVTTDANGDYTFHNVSASDYDIAIVPPTGWEQTSPSDRLIGLQNDYKADYAYLWEIDPETGFAIHAYRINENLQNWPDGNPWDHDRFQGLAADPNHPGVFYSILKDQEGFPFPAYQAYIHRLTWQPGDASVGESEIEDTGYDGFWGGIDINPGNGWLQGIALDDFDEIDQWNRKNKLFAYDIGPDDFYVQGAMFSEGENHSYGDCAFDSYGNLNVIADGRLYQVNPYNANVIQSFALTGISGGDGMVYNDDEGYFWIGGSRLHRLSSNGIATAYGQNLPFSLEGLTYMESGFSDRPVRITGNETVTEIDFGMKANVAGVSGRVVYDLNTNGEIDAAEQIGMANQKVFLDQNGNGVIDTGESVQTTNSQGYYNFGNLTPGVYTIALVRTPGYETTYPNLTISNNYLILLQAGSFYTADFAVASLVDIRGVAYDDTNVNGQQDETEPGLAGVTIYVDQDQNGVKNEFTFTTIAGPSATLSDFSTATSTITVNDVYAPLADLDVLVNITHPYTNDLKVCLVSPRGTRVELFSQVGGSGDNFDNVVLDDEAANSITSPTPVGGPFAGFYKPEGTLADFDGELPNGMWTLEVSDEAAGDSGTLNHWAMKLTVGDFVTQTDASGYYQFINLPPAPMIVRQELGHLRSPTEPDVLGEQIVEPFDGDLSGYQQVESGDASSLVVRAAYGGETGLLAGRWIKGGPVVQKGDTLSTYVKFKDANYGSAYFGFGAGDDQALMLAMYPGLNKMALSTLTGGYDSINTQYTAIAEVEQGFASDHWYRIEIDWGLDNTIIARLFTDNGGLINQVDIAGYTIWPESEGNLAFRAVGGDEVYFDQVSVKRGGERKILVPFGWTDGIDFGSAGDGVIQGAKYQDTNGNGLFDDGRPLPGWRIYHDANNNGLFDFDTATFGNVDNYGLDDYETNAVPIAVSDVEGVIRDVNVTVDIDHGNVSDLTAWLISPAGTRVELFNHVGGAGDEMRMTVFDDSGEFAITAGSSPFTGSYQPTGTLFDFVAEDPNGLWHLVILDDQANGHEGTLDNVLITLETGDLDILTDVNGLYLGGQLPAGQYMLREQQQTGWLTTQPGDGTHEVFINSGQWHLGVDFGNTRMGSIAGTVYHDIDENDAQNGSEPGMDHWAVYLDLNDDEVINENTWGYTNDTAVVIRDEDTITSPILATYMGGRILDVNVTLNIEHSYIADLDVFLVSPMGTRVELFTDVGGGGDHMVNAVFDDSAASSVTTGVAPFTGSWQPEGSLATFNGENPNGYWFLEITDDSAADIGALLNWQLDITEGDPVTTTDADGNYQFDQVLPGDQNIRVLLEPGWSYFNPASGKLTPSLTIDEDMTDQDFGIAQWTCQLPVPNGDFNGDCIVGLLDLDILGLHWGTATGADKSIGDANGDGAVGLLDLDILGQTWGMNGNSMSLANTSTTQSANWWLLGNSSTAPVFNFNSLDSFSENNDETLPTIRLF